MSTEELLEMAENELKVYKHISYGTARLLLDTMYGFMPQQPDEVFYEDVGKYKLTPEDWVIGIDDYCMLIDKVRTFDLDAAYKLVDMARDKTILEFNFGDKLSAAFQWDSTPDGWQYWRDLTTKLEQLSPTPPKYYRIKTYFDMVRQVANIDMDAFHLLLKMPFLKRDFNYGDLEQAFTWSETEQDHYYWRKINSGWRG